MKTLGGILLLLVLALSACSSQVTVPTANLQPVLDSLISLRVQIATLNGQLTTAQTQQTNLVGRITVLEARPQITFNGKVGDFLNGTGTWVTVTVVKTGSATFTGTTWRKAVYIPGISSAWVFSAWPAYSTNTPAIDYVVKREIKTDSLVLIRQDPAKSGGTPDLVVEYLGALVP